ncbi:hypothetical protein EI94DRAFT_1582603 [Lactarius quietus]|nr:hypothetical protein EI94DRAFT_1582603 [Lactarius quietus]
MYDEPWTADTFWDFQSQIPPHACPLCFVLYADKAKLSSFSTAKSYPVVAHCVNLPVEIRNGNGVDSGCIVGWLPIVPEFPAESGKTTFTNFKCDVWHRTFNCIIELIIKNSKAGCWLQGADGVKKQYFPAITMLSADYEEQSVISLTRGSRAKQPCLVCLAPLEKLSDLSVTWEPRTVASTKNIIERARCLNKKECEGLLSAHGIRDVEVGLFQLLL